MLNRIVESYPREKNSYLFYLISLCGYDFMLLFWASLTRLQYGVLNKWIITATCAVVLIKSVNFFRVHLTYCSHSVVQTFCIENNNNSDVFGRDNYIFYALVSQWTTRNNNRSQCSEGNAVYAKQWGNYKIKLVCVCRPWPWNETRKLPKCNMTGNSNIYVWINYWGHSSINNICNECN